jgi:hypothetical protein
MPRRSADPMAVEFVTTDGHVKLLDFGLSQASVSGH